MPSRRTTLAMLLLVATAGCVGGPLAGSPDRSPTDRSPTASPGECIQDGQNPVDPVRDDVTPSTSPERPATWNESSVREYVVAFEKAWSRNDALTRESTRVTVGITDVSVTEADDGYRVRLVSQTNTWAAGLPEGNRTATVIHGDGPLIPVAYSLTDDRLVRSAGDYDATPTVGLRSGRTVRCWDED